MQEVTLLHDASRVEISAYFLIALQAPIYAVVHRQENDPALVLGQLYVVLCKHLPLFLRGSGHLYVRTRLPQVLLRYHGVGDVKKNSKETQYGPFFQVWTACGCGWHLPPRHTTESLKTYTFDFRCSQIRQSCEEFAPMICSPIHFFWKDHAFVSLRRFLICACTILKPV